MKQSNKKFIGILKRILLAISDIALFAIANALAYFLAYGNIFSSDYSAVLFNYPHFLLLSALAVICHYLLGLYKNVWTFAGSEEVVACTFAAFIDAGILFLVDKILFKAILGFSTIMPFYAYISLFIIQIIFVNAPRISYKMYRRFYARIHTHGKNSKAKRVMIVGAGYMGNTIIEDMLNNRSDKYKVVVAIDDNPSKIGKKINTVKIAGSCDEIPRIAQEYNVDDIIICIPSASKQRQNEILQIALSTNKKVKISPSIEDILENGVSKNKVRNVEINDLLARDEVKLDIRICRYLIGKTVLVTGGGGSIGSEICNQCARYKPSTIIIFDIYENCAFELANDLNKKYGDSINICVRIGSVRDKERLDEIFNEFHPDVVFHAAAHKHVPLMEDSPCEAVKNNIFGTYNVAVMANKYKVPKMVILSTDKAVNPTNVMGCTKRITEIIVQYMDTISDSTEYVAVRFGNVLGSHGSVIPIFKKQIEQGGPITVTHPDITRYFMTIPEAAQLVCQAGGLAKGGEIFVLDMGKPVKIIDLAKNLIRLSGFTEDEIGIEITGLRPGEKLYEELAMDSEIAQREKTANEKIYVTHPVDIENIGKEQFEALLEDLHHINNDNVREKLMKRVPNYHPADN